MKIWYPEYSNISELCRIGQGTIVHSHVWIGEGVIIGKRCRIQAFAFLPTGVVVEDDVFIGPHVCFTNDRNPPSEELLRTWVRKGACIGANSSVLCGIEIGEGAMIGMGSVVLSSVPPQQMWAGNPAKFKKVLYKKETL